MREARKQRIHIDLTLLYLELLGRFVEFYCVVIL